MRKQVIRDKGYHLIWIVKIKIGIGTILQFDIKMTSCYNNIRLNGKRTWQTKSMLTGKSKCDIIMKLSHSITKNILKKSSKKSLTKRKLRDMIIKSLEER